jgi:hypothetical protein
LTQGVRGAACGRERIERRVFGRGAGGEGGAGPGVRCIHRFPMRRESAWGGEYGLPHGMTCGVWSLAWHASWGCRMHNRGGR